MLKRTLKILTESDSDTYRWSVANGTLVKSSLFFHLSAIIQCPEYWSKLR